MIIVVAALGFETEEDRDHAVAITRDVQAATREEEAGCHAYCFAPDPSCQRVFKFMSSGKIAMPSLRILSIIPIIRWWNCLAPPTLKRASTGPI